MSDDLNQTTELVAKLRDPRYMHPPRWMLEEAADEIERLRVALRTVIGTLDDPTGGQHVADMRHASKVAEKALANG